MGHRKRGWSANGLLRDGIRPLRFPRVRTNIRKEKEKKKRRRGRALTGTKRFISSKQALSNLVFRCESPKRRKDTEYIYQRKKKKKMNKEKERETLATVAHANTNIWDKTE